MESKRREIPHLRTRVRYGEKPHRTVWGKLMICSCGHKFSRRVWNRKDGSSNVGYICYTINNKGSLQTRKNKGLPLTVTCDTPQIQEGYLPLLIKNKIKLFIKFLFVELIISQLHHNFQHKLIT